MKNFPEIKGTSRWTIENLRDPGRASFMRELIGNPLLHIEGSSQDVLNINALGDESNPSSVDRKSHIDSLCDAIRPVFLDASSHLPEAAREHLMKLSFVSMVPDIFTNLESEDGKTIAALTGIHSTIHAISANVKISEYNAQNVHISLEVGLSGYMNHDPKGGYTCIDGNGKKYHQAEPLDHHQEKVKQIKNLERDAIDSSRHKSSAQIKKHLNKHVKLMRFNQTVTLKDIQAQLRRHGNKVPLAMESYLSFDIGESGIIDDSISIETHIQPAFLKAWIQHQLASIKTLTPDIHDKIKFLSQAISWLDPQTPYHTEAQHQLASIQRYVLLLENIDIDEKLSSLPHPDLIKNKLSVIVEQILSDHNGLNEKILGCPQIFKLTISDKGNKQYAYSLTYPGHKDSHQLISRYASEKDHENETDQDCISIDGALIIEEDGTIFDHKKPQVKICDSFIYQLLLKTTENINDQNIVFVIELLYRLQKSDSNIELHGNVIKRVAKYLSGQYRLYGIKSWIGIYWKVSQFNIFLKSLLIIVFSILYISLTILGLRSNCENLLIKNTLPEQKPPIHFKYLERPVKLNSIFDNIHQKVHPCRRRCQDDINHDYRPSSFTRQ